MLWCGGTHTPAHATNAKGCKNPIQGRPADQPASTRATQPPSHPPDNDCVVEVCGVGGAAGVGIDAAGVEAEGVVAGINCRGAGLWWVGGWVGGWVVGWVEWGWWGGGWGVL